MSVHLRKPETGPSGYFLRQPDGSTERGPFSIENLRDLADFQHVNPDSWIRPENEPEARPITDFPEILKLVFPERKQFSLKPKEIAPDPDELNLPPIDTKSFYRCEPDANPAPTPSPSPVQPHSFSSPKKEATDIERILAEDAALLKLRKPPEPKPKKPRFRSGPVFQLVRWGTAILLLFILVSTWRAFADQPSWAIFISIPLLLLLMVLIALDLIDFMLDFVTNRTSCQPPPEIDYSEAERFLHQQDWPSALRELEKILNADPRQLQAYRQGISAAVAAGNLKKADQLYQAAQKYLTSHDRNLLEGALNRHGIFPQNFNRKDQ